MQLTNVIFLLICVNPSRALTYHIMLNHPHYYAPCTAQSFLSDLIVLAGVGAPQAMDYVNHQIRSIKVKTHSKELAYAHINAHTHVPAMLSWNLNLTILIKQYRIFISHFARKMHLVLIYTNAKFDGSLNPSITFKYNWTHIYHTVNC